MHLLVGLPDGGAYDRVVRSADEAINILKSGQVTQATIHYNLPDGIGTGLQVARWMEESSYLGVSLPAVVEFKGGQSQIAEMATCLERARRQSRFHGGSGSKLPGKRPIKRVCIYGGPGVGKSVLARWLASELVFKGLDCDYVDEFVKGWAYQGITPDGFDQIHIFGQQVKREETPLIGGKPFIVTDSPILLSAAYAEFYHMEYFKELASMAMCVEDKYPSLNLLITRSKNAAYDQNGRFQTQEQLQCVDAVVAATLARYYGDNYMKICRGDRNWIPQGVADAIRLRMA